jgi:hypothetical protein
MKSIFDTKDNLELVERFKKLSPETQALWGTMSVSQMIAHTHEPLMVMTGNKVIKYTLLGMFFGNYLKKKYIKDRGFGKNLPTHKQFIVSDKKQFENELEKMLNTLQLILDKGHAIITKNKHPFFGNMTPEEWGDIMYLHSDHHLKQFGV